jgi:hypothetical protein
MTERSDDKNGHVEEICAAVRESKKYAERLAVAEREGRDIVNVSFRLRRHAHTDRPMHMSIEGRLIDSGGRIVADVYFDEATTSRIVTAARPLLDGMPSGWSRAGSLMFDLRHDFVQPTWL